MTVGRMDLINGTYMSSASAQLTSGQLSTRHGTRSEARGRARPAGPNRAGRGSLTAEKGACLLVCLPIVRVEFELIEVHI